MMSLNRRLPVLAITVALLASAAAVAPQADAFKMPWSKSKDEQPAVEAPAQATAEPDAEIEKPKKGKRMPKMNLGNVPKPGPNNIAPPVIEPSVTAPKVQVSSPLSNEVKDLKVEDPIESHELPPDKTFVAVDDPKNPLGISVSADKLNSAAGMISAKKYAEAQKMLSPLKEWLVEATEAHINLHKTLKGIPSAQVQAELEKQLALQFALLRDKAFFQLGMLAVGQNDHTQAVKNLSKVIQSQPRSPMGAQAYEILQKIGFTEKIQLKEDRKPDAPVTP